MADKPIRLCDGGITSVRSTSRILSHITMYNIHCNEIKRPSKMKKQTEPKLNVKNWREYIREQSLVCSSPDRSEIIKPFTINYTLLGHIIKIKQETT